MRRQRTSLQRAKIFNAHNGICHICGGKIHVGESWDLEHIIPLDISGDDTDDNLAPAHVLCHKSKTRDDKKDIAKCNRVSAKHKGAWKSRNPLPGGKGSKLRKKVNGQVVPR